MKEIGFITVRRYDYGGSKLHTEDIVRSMNKYLEIANICVDGIISIIEEKDDFIIFYKKVKFGTS